MEIAEQDFRSLSFPFCPSSVDQAGDVTGVIWRNLLFLVLAAIFFLGITAKKTGRRLD